MELEFKESLMHLNLKLAAKFKRKRGLCMLQTYIKWLKIRNNDINLNFIHAINN